ncbi:MAG TPA: YciI family protein [Solirubrobacteraceae bacterium]|nr:YciI family protein [Solirubrobacteraceae bacterium]
MKYLLMICAGEDREASTPRMGIDQWVEESDRAGTRLLGRPLDPPETAATVRVRGGETLLSDGPFAEAKEYVAGFDIVDCADLDEAIELAANHPVAAFGAVEVRPFFGEFDFPDAAREWARTEPSESWALFMCLDGIPATDEEEAAIRAGSIAWGERLTERGTMIVGQPLAHADTATCVRVDGGETLLSDGPFVEAKEFIGGFAILQGVTRQEAIGLAAEHPLAAYHRVEVRAFEDA